MSDDPTSARPSFDRSVLARREASVRTTMTLTGRLGSDAVEGGCTYLDSADGIRYEVLYPRGWSLRRNPVRLEDTNGRVVATGGQLITVRGSVDEQMVSICMSGPIFRAESVLSIRDD